MTSTLLLLGLITFCLVLDLHCYQYQGKCIFFFLAMTELFGSKWVTTENTATICMAITKLVTFMYTIL